MNISGIPRPLWSSPLQALLEEINRVRERQRFFTAEKESKAEQLREAEAAAKSAQERLDQHDDGGKLSVVFHRVKYLCVRPSIRASPL